MLPRLFLALDNCFASKRWTEPLEWMQIAHDAGVFCIEASADNECDPLYTPPDALHDWIAKVQSASSRSGVKVVNLYSGHGTYTTLGLAHPDVRVRDHIQHRWLEPMLQTAAALDAGMGFFCHAFPQSIMKDPEKYQRAESDLFARLAQVAAYAAELGLSSLSLEQMYSPHQIPWTISGAHNLLREVYRRQKAPLYITLDTGHHVGQRRFLPPDRAAVEAYCAGKMSAHPWLGYLNETPLQNADAFLQALQARHYLFAVPEDGDLYAWLRALGAYAPIIHLQQTDGSTSTHRPFTAAYNQTGQVSPDKLLSALLDAYRTINEPVGFPARCSAIYLTLELFSGTADHPDQVIANVCESAAYWRQFIPEDGLVLDQLPSITKASS